MPGLSCHNLDPSRKNPGVLMSGDDGPIPSDGVMKSEASTTAAR